MPNLRIVVCIFTILLAAPAWGQNIRSALPGAAPPPADIETLGWLAGSWEGTGFGSQGIETYSRPFAGQIAGHFVLQGEDGGVAFYELMQIVRRGDSLVYRLRHFNADLSGWEDAKQGKSVEFPLVAVEDGDFYFDGLTLDREGDDRLTVWVAIEEDGKVQEFPFHYRRMK